MSRGVNLVILMGNVGRDPEVRYMPSGGAVANFSLATSKQWKKDGEPQEKTEWHRIVCFNRTAEVVGEYVKKGTQVYLRGELQTRKWQDKNTGQDRYTTEIVANEIQFIGGGAASHANSGHTNGASSGTNQNAPAFADAFDPDDPNSVPF